VSDHELSDHELSDHELSDDEVARRLRTADLELVGRFADASNATLLVRLLDRDPRSLEQFEEDLGRPPEVDDLPADGLAVYKPLKGERPLWDFPDHTLHLREVAAYELSRALGWDLVPVTVLREDGPVGPGSLQRFVAHDPDEHYFALLEHGGQAIREQLVDMVVFDLLANNADRKGGHVLLERPVPDEADPGSSAEERIRLIDHGVTFHVQPKLRTVGWHFAGEPVPERLRADLVRVAEALSDALGQLLAQLLAPHELDALRERAQVVASLRRLPEPVGPRPTPWPLL
jgi:uncharacterized repeat protein (TIGR03843 family)